MAQKADIVTACLFMSGKHSQDLFMPKIQMVLDVFEPYAQTSEGIPIWVNKGVLLTHENLLNNLFILSHDLAKFFEIKHNDLVRRNIRKLQKEKYLPYQLRTFAQLIEVGKKAQIIQTVFAFTRHQTERLIMDFSGTKARRKKFEILMRLQSIEENVLAGNYAQARQKSATWDGVQLLTDLGFTPSLPNQMATKKDIATFLDIPAGTLTTFLAKHTDQITPTKLTKKEIRAVGKKANRLHAYTQDDVFKIAFWMDTEIGKQLKAKIFGDIGVYATPAVREEVEWKAALAKVFACLGFQYQYRIGKYTVDFFVEKLDLVLECDRDNHRYYNQREEKARDAYITKYYTIIRFNSQISLETLVNRIIRMKEIPPKAVIKLYIPPEKARQPQKHST